MKLRACKGCKHLVNRPRFGGEIDPWCLLLGKRAGKWWCIWKWLSTERHRTPVGSAKT